MLQVKPLEVLGYTLLSEAPIQRDQAFIQRNGSEYYLRYLISEVLLILFSKIVI